MHRTETIAGVLIGGQSRRMGTCKALLPFAGSTFVEHVVQIARTVTDEVVLLGHASLPISALNRMVRLADESSSAGPLAGLVPLLEYAGDRRALLIACDMPLLEPRLLKRLLDACDESVDGVAFHVGGDGEFFPCCAAFRPRTVSQARLELTRSASLQALIGRLQCRILEVDATEAHRLRSFNTPVDYAELMQYPQAAAAGIPVR